MGNPRSDRTERKYFAVFAAAMAAINLASVELVAVSTVSLDTLQCVLLGSLDLSSHPLLDFHLPWYRVVIRL